MTKSFAFLAVALTCSAGNAQPIVCQSEKGAGYPWAWREIDGKRCWYKGKAGMDKKQLRWAETTKTPAAGTKRRAPAMIEGTPERERLLHSYWPPLPQTNIFGDFFDTLHRR